MKHLRLFAISMILGAGLIAQPAPKSKSSKPTDKAIIPTQKPNPFEVDPEWRSWKQRFASASPLLSLNKNWPKAFEITDANLNIVLQRKSEIKFKEPLSLGDRKFTDYDVVESDDAVRFEAYDQIDNQEQFGVNAIQALKEESRFATLIGNMESLIEKRKDDELLILFTGATHGIDLYFNFFLKDPDKPKLKPILKRRDEIVWAAAPLKLETPYYSKDFHQLKEKVDGIPTKLETFERGGVVHATAFLNRLYYYQNLVRERLKLADLKHDAARLGTIVFMDIHRAEEAEHITSLPTVKTLKASGIKSITLGVEAWKYGNVYSMNEFRRFSLTPVGTKFEDYEVQLLKENHPQWYKRYEEGVVVNAAAHALYNKIKSWVDAGLSVNITGLEDFENIGK